MTTGRNICAGTLGEVPRVGGQCTAEPADEGRCTGTATVLLRAGCVGEHVGIAANCARHAAWHLGREWLCGPCLERGEESIVRTEVAALAEDQEASDG